MPDKLTEEIREIVCHGLNLQLVSGAEREQLWASADAIEDTQLAIKAFSQNPFPDGRGEGSGEGYLRLYGLFQALFVQQDATRHLSSALGVRFDARRIPELFEVRHIRNAAFGHPTEQNHGVSNGPHYNSVSRHSLSRESFDIMSFDQQGGRHFKTIVIDDLLEVQEREIRLALQTVLDVIGAKILAHRACFRDAPLAACFHSSLGYMLEQVQRGISGDLDRLPLAAAALATISELIEKAFTGIKSRELDNDDFLEEFERKINPALRRIHSSLNGTSTEDDAADMAEMALERLRRQLTELQECCSSIDEHFASESLMGPNVVFPSVSPAEAEALASARASLEQKLSEIQRAFTLQDEVD